MPLITRVFIKSGLAYFALSLIFGILLQFDSFSAQALIPLFWHTLMLGWITQIIMGVSMWMFPNRRKDESMRANWIIWLTFWTLNIGLFLRIISEPFINTSPNSLFKIILVISAFLQFLAAIGYVLEIWPRIISKKKSIRERKKEA